jgi:radical SAM superfamily enzyme YgiQ (UPF0313 family)
MSYSAKKNKTRLERERNMVAHSPDAPLKMVLCYPSRYSVGMANLGFQRVYELFNLCEGVYCDRAFFPDPQDVKEHFQKQIPVQGIESLKPLNEFDVIAFSFTYELDYIPALEMLRFCKLPLRAEERRRSRSKRRKYPLIIAGGIAISANPEPMADFLDLIIIGEAEPVARPLADSIKNLGADFGPENLAAEFLGQVGVYVPSAYEPDIGDGGRIQSIKSLPAAPAKVERAAASEKDLPVVQKIFTHDMEFSELGLIELMRGCRRGCRFCLEGYFYRPVREASLPAVVAGIEELAKNRHKLGLIAAIVPDYSKLNGLLEYLLREDIKLSISSLRIEAIDERLIAMLKQSRNKTITLAPETGSMRLKCLINKEISEDRVISGMKIIGKYGFERIKLYYQVGFPEESMSDIDSIVESARQISSALAQGARAKKYPGVIELGINTFVPKAWTALQWAAMASRGELEHKINRLRDQLGNEPGFVLKPGSVREALLQGIISRADRSISNVLESISAGRSTPNELLRDQEMAKKYLRRREIDEILPWDIIEPGVKKSYLQRELERGAMGKISQGCRQGCRDCGAC